MSKAYLLLVTLLCLSITRIVASGYEMQAAKTEITFKVSKKLILVEATVNQETGYFLFDTGVSELILNKTHFKKYKTIYIDQDILDIAGASTLQSRLRVKDFRMGAIRRENFNAPQIEMPGLEALLGLKILGLIGFEVIMKFQTIIDYDHRLITLTQLDSHGNALGHPSSPPDYNFKLEMAKFMLVLKVKFSNNTTLRLALDSGSTINLISNQYKKRFKKISRQNRKISFQGALTSVVQADYFLLENVLIQNRLIMSYWKAAFENISHLRDRNLLIDGIIGINFFRIGRVAINYQQRSLQLWEGENAYQAYFQKVAGEQN